MCRRTWAYHYGSTLAQGKKHALKFGFMLGKDLDYEEEEEEEEEKEEEEEAAARGAVQQVLPDVVVSRFLRVYLLFLARQKKMSSEQNEHPVKTNRCWQCNRKIGLVGFQCRCGYYYCGEHRYADRHACAFDYKTYEREHLKKQNHRVVAEKVQKI
ncbi:UNVERIFIED_CONTAM: hypothetical protein H355_007988 [Colinus virginianus]|nr:hypothetical protein H355_007988 [Colinus virginianus]